MDKSDVTILVNFFNSLERQGPGLENLTLKAWNLTGLDAEASITAADLGCGNGGPTLSLAKHTKAQITAVDIFEDFLARLNERAVALGVSKQVRTHQGSMNELPFEKNSLDLIWSEGAIYNMGFKLGIQYLRPFLKEDGVLAVSEVIWTTKERPKEVEDFWNANYPEIATSKEKITILEQNGYKLLGDFVLPEEAWLEGYYLPIEAHVPSFLAKHPDHNSAKVFTDSMLEEAAFYKMYKDYFSYGFYVVKKR